MVYPVCANRGRGIRSPPEAFPRHLRARCHRLFRDGGFRRRGAGASGLCTQLRRGLHRSGRHYLGVRADEIRGQPVRGQADRPWRRTHHFDHRHRDRCSLERIRRNRTRLPAAAHSARYRRHRLGDVQCFGDDPSARSSRPIVARALGRFLSGRIFARRHGRTSARWRARRNLAHRAFLLLCGDAVGGRCRRPRAVAVAREAKSGCSGADAATHSLSRRDPGQAVSRRVPRELLAGVDVIRRPCRPRAASGRRSPA